MTGSLNVAAVVGSLRRESYTRQLTQALARLAAPALQIEIVPIGGLPLYNQDDEPAPPQAWVDFRERIKSSAAVLFATPEYNRSMSGCLKNAIDVGSRPYGHSVWAGRPAAVISCSPGNLGGFGAHHHLRQTLVAVNMPAMPHPEAYIPGSDRLFAADGDFANPATRDFCVQFVKSFEFWIRQRGVIS